MMDLIFKTDMFNQKIIISGIILTEIMPFGAEAKYLQYGALGILLLILIWYSRNSYKDTANREKATKKEREDLIKAHKEEKEVLRAEAARERDRYAELHKEIMIYLQNKG
jgi:hypothetical protein